MPSTLNSHREAFVIVDPNSTLPDELTFASPDPSLSHPDFVSSSRGNSNSNTNMNQQGSVAAIDMANEHDDHPDRRQVTVSVRPTHNYAGEPDVRDPQRDQRQHAGGQPLPPGDDQAGSVSVSTTRTGRAPSLSNLSDYARSMLLHTKQQMDATSGSPPPAHLNVAGPAGDTRYRSGSLSQTAPQNIPVSSSHHSSSFSRGTSISTSTSTSPGRSQHHHNNSPHRHAHRQSLVNGTTAALPNGI